MHILVEFRFNYEESPVAFTGIEGDVTDILLPSVGDKVQHSDTAGAPFEGKVTDRVFRYDMPNGNGVNGAIVVTLCLDRTTTQ